MKVDTNGFSQLQCAAPLERDHACEWCELLILCVIYPAQVYNDRRVSVNYVLCSAPSMRILHQPLELPCRALVCIACMVEWFKVLNCSGVKCSCCFMDTSLTASRQQYN